MAIRSTRYGRPALRTRALPTPAVLAAALLGVLLLASLALWAYLGDGRVVPQVLPGPRVDAVAFSSVGAAPARFYGQTIAVGGTVRAVVDGRVLVLTDDLVPSNQDAVVVMAADRVMPAGIRVGERVVVHGTVREFDPARWDLDMLPEDMLALWAGRTGIVASAVTPNAPRR